ncbi:MAG: acyl-CoA synthetase FdrA [Chloroflexi bacterium]|nr:MAG: acyl-CoA synthetase FdrA [Chloroflexota bacterium]MCE7860615.1 acyl-CoA synthetase FdrA [Chloroflexi bacterium CFX2]
MPSGFVIRKNQYYDSVFLMGISKRISDVSGVQQNAVLMGSETNKGLLADIGIRDPQIDAAQPNDLIVAMTADTPQIISEVLDKLDEFLIGGVQAATTSNPHSFEEGLAQKPSANLAVISVPGEYAAREARKALEAGLNVFLFSDNVSIKDELELKQFAAEKKLLVMGPDCGTSLIGGVGIGFANVVRKGQIGAIGAAGTGLQEFTSQIHNAGFGISHAIGTGGHDLSDSIGGMTTLAALDALEADPATKVIAIISKPPGVKTLAQLSERFKTCTKPVIGCFLGTRAEPYEVKVNFQRASTIDEAVQLSIKLAGAESVSQKTEFTPEELEWISREKASWSDDQKYVRGIFAGGTFCYQSQQIFRDAGTVIHSNAPLEAKNKLHDSDHSVEHTIVDMGSDEYTLGRPHPMIDGTLRKQRILTEARDPQTAILLLDFILGYNASMDPVGELLDAIIEARQIVDKRGGNLTVVASVCGTDDDPQDLNLQVKLLKEAGVIVFHSNANAASFCCELLK